MGALKAKCGFTIELAGSGTAGTAPNIDKLLLACGFVDVNVPATSDTYTFESPLTHTAVDIDTHPGDIRKYACNSACGSVKLVFKAGEPGKAIFEFDGAYEAVSEASGGADEHVSADGVPCKGLTATVGGQTVILSSLEIDVKGRRAADRKDMAATNGVQVPVLVSIDPTITAKFEAPAIATLNVESLFAAGTKVAFQVVLGGAAGNILTIDVDGFISEMPGQSYEDDILQDTIVAEMSRDSGDTDLQLVYT